MTPSCVTAAAILPKTAEAEEEEEAATELGS
jgi:hypothetical protein